MKRHTSTGSAKAAARILRFAPESVDSRAFVPYLNSWLTPQNPVGFTPREGSIPSSGTKMINKYGHIISVN